MSDDFTMALKLCDDDGIVRSGAMHHGTDYPCTGSAHFAGEHIECISPAHPGAGLPPDLLALLRDPSVILPGDAEVWELIAKGWTPTEEET